MGVFLMGQCVELLSTALQTVPVFQLGIVAFRDPLGAVQKTPAAAGDHRCAVVVTWTEPQRYNGMVEMQ